MSMPWKKVICLEHPMVFTFDFWLPFKSDNVEVQKVDAEAGHIGPSSMLLPALSGVLAAVRRIISRRNSMKVEIMVTM